MSLVLICGDTITFAVGLSKANETVTKLTLDNLITKHGLLIPISDRIFNLLDHLDTGKIETPFNYWGFIGMLLTPDGRLYEYFLPGEVGDTNTVISRTRISYGKGVMHFRDNSLQAEETLQGIIEYVTTPNEILDEVDKHYGHHRYLLQTFTFAELIACLNK